MRNSVCAEKDYELECRGSFPGKSKRSVSLLHHAQAGYGSHPTSFAKDTVWLLPGVNRPRREADRLPPFSAKAKNGGAKILRPNTFPHSGT
jgi:hypothetical protein